MYSGVAYATPDPDMFELSCGEVSIHLLCPRFILFQLYTLVTCAHSGQRHALQSRLERSTVRTKKPHAMQCDRVGLLFFPLRATRVRMSEASQAELALATLDNACHL